jgi:hypothetical protein
MKLPEMGVKRPVATAMIFIAIVMLGLVSLKMLPLDLMPEMEFPSITIITIYPGGIRKRNRRAGYQTFRNGIICSRKSKRNRIDFKGKCIIYSFKLQLGYRCNICS